LNRKEIEETFYRKKAYNIENIKKRFFNFGLQRVSKVYSTVLIASNKIRPPLVQPTIIHRPYYSHLARAVLSTRLVSITAPAGYGKTTLMVAIHQALAGRDTDPKAGDRKPQVWVAWYSLGAADTRVDTFLAHLVESLSLALPGFGEGTRRTLNSVEEINREHPLVVGALCDELWKWGDRANGGTVVLNLDDFHHAGGSPGVSACVAQLLREAPPFVHFLVAGRRHSGLPLSELALRFPVREIGVRELRLGTDEVKSLLKDCYRLKLGKNEIQKIVDRTEGWPAGVVMLARVLAGKDRDQRSKVLNDLLPYRKYAFEYFAQEVLGRQNPEARRLLVQASLFETLNPQALEVVLGVPEADTWLEGLLESGLFLTAVRGQEGPTYRFHTLFREYLHGLLEKTFSRDDIRKLHFRAASHYESAGQLDLAMDHLLSAGDTQKAVELVKRRGQEMLDRGMVAQVLKWLEQLPSGIRDQDPYLLYLKGFVYQHSNPSLALDCLDRAATAFASSGELHLQVRALIYMTTIYSLQNRVEELEKTASRIPVVSALARDPWSRGVLTVAALSQATWTDKLSRGKWLFNLSQRFPLDEDWYWASLAYACMIHYRLGDLEVARRLITEALELPVVKNNDVWKGMALVLYHVVLYCQDDEKGGEKVREELWEIGERYGSAYYMAYAERARAFPYLHRGQWDRARELLNSSRYFFNRAGNYAMEAITRLDLAVVAANEGAAEPVVDEARDAYRQLCSLTSGQGLQEFGQSLLGVVLKAAGDLDGAERALTASAAASKRKGAKQILAGTSLHLADLYQERGDRKKAASHLKTALGLAQKERYVVFWDWHRATVLKQCLNALRWNIYPGYAAHLLLYWFPEEAVEQLTAVLPEVRPPVRKTIIRLLEERNIPFSRVGQARAVGEAPAPVRIFCLGAFRVEVGGRLIPNRAWKTRKVVGLLKYLVLSGGRKVPREQVREMFWPDAPPEASAASLRVTINRLRKALDYYQDEGLAASGLLGADREHVWFRAYQVEFQDLVEFTRLYDEGKGLLAREETRRGLELLEKAAALYHGPLLEEDLYANWTLPERERFELMYLDTLLLLGRAYTKSPTRRERAIQCFKEALSINRYREDIYEGLALAHLAAGNRAEALRVLEDCSRMVREEFGLKPNERIRDLARQLGKKF